MRTTEVLVLIVYSLRHTSTGIIGNPWHFKIYRCAIVIRDEHFDHISHEFLNIRASFFWFFCEHTSMIKCVSCYAFQIWFWNVGTKLVVFLYKEISSFTLYNTIQLKYFIFVHQIHNRYQFVDVRAPSHARRIFSIMYHSASSQPIAYLHQAIRHHLLVCLNPVMDKCESTTMEK